MNIADDSPSRALALVPLDPVQRRVAELPAGRATLVLGEAGHGKTTVAIHRLAHLARSAQASGNRFRAAVVVPSEGLRGLIERALVRLGVDVPVLTFDRFARAQARRAFAELPRREGHDAAPAVVRLKRDPALGSALRQIAARAPGVIDDDADAPPVETKAHAVRGDLQHLFGDRALVAGVVAESKGRLPDHAVAEALEHTRVQFGMTSEQAFAHVDGKRLKTADRRSLDEGTPEADAGTMDVEDYAVLFELDRLRAARLGLRATRPRAHDCLVLDEAQEMAPIELALLGRSLARGGSLIVAGDADQQLDDRACFDGWGATMRALGAEDHERFVLDVGYRCPPEVVALARSVLADPAPLARGGVEALAGEEQLAAWLAGRLEAIVTREPRASAAVIVRSPLVARRLAGRLRAHLPVRLVWGGDFRFAPGVDVTTVDQVRGLEFEHVFVPDASTATYGGDPASRRALYVAITRARKSVTLASAG
jgi:superfamily I DNA/RNA helicase